jgi:hypothetical protein
MISFIPLFIIVLGVVVLVYAVIQASSQKKNVQASTVVEPEATNKVTELKPEAKTKAVTKLPTVNNDQITYTNNMKPDLGVWTGFKLGFGFALGSFLAMMIIMFVMSFLFMGVLVGFLSSLLPSIAG